MGDTGNLYKTKSRNIKKYGGNNAKYPKYKLWMNYFFATGAGAGFSFAPRGAKPKRPCGQSPFSIACGPRGPRCPHGHGPTIAIIKTFTTTIRRTSPMNFLTLHPRQPHPQEQPHEHPQSQEQTLFSSTTGVEIFVSLT